MKMPPDPRLEATVDKILNKTRDAMLSGLDESYKESTEILANSQGTLEREYDRIIDEGKKEAAKIHRQIVGSSDLEARNKQLLLVEEAIDGVFEKALKEISGQRDKDYSTLVRSLIAEATETLGTTDIVLYCTSRDAETVRELLQYFPGSELASEAIDCLGGIKAKSKDGSMTFDNTVDARFDRLKPLIRKEIATKFGIGS